MRSFAVIATGPAISVATGSQSTTPQGQQSSLPSSRLLPGSSSSTAPSSGTFCRCLVTAVRCLLATSHLFDAVFATGTANSGAAEIYGPPQQASVHFSGPSAGATLGMASSLGTFCFYQLTVAALPAVSHPLDCLPRHRNGHLWWPRGPTSDFDELGSLGKR
jgi:hypothetical protein